MESGSYSKKASIGIWLFGFIENIESFEERKIQIFKAKIHLTMKSFYFDG